MNKREFMEAAWVHISKRIPPDEEHEFVLIYNSQNGYMTCFPASWARTYAEICLDGKGAELSWDRRFTHWMLLYGPQNGLTWAKYNEANKRQKRK